MWPKYFADSISPAEATRILDFYYVFWNKVMGSSTHIASLLIFSYEVKALGRR